MSEERRREANERSAGAVRARLRTQRDTCEKTGGRNKHRAVRAVGWTARFGVRVEVNVCKEVPRTR